MPSVKTLSRAALVLLAISGAASAAKPAHLAARPAPVAIPTAIPVAIPWDVQQSAQCTAAISAAEQRHGLPAGLLATIARVESGRPITSMGDVRPWPWTIDANSTGLFLESRAAAVAWVAQAQGRHIPYIDVGCLQVDLQLHPGAFRSLDEAFDPAANADYAARYLVSLRAEAGGDWNVAVGLYHSHTPELADAYRDRVAAVGAGIVSGSGAGEPLYVRALRQGTLRLALAGGGSLVINFRRQPTTRPMRPKSRCEMAVLLDPLLSSPMRVHGCARPGRPERTATGAGLAG